MKIEARHTHHGYHAASGQRIPSVSTISKLIDRPEGLIAWAYNCGVQGIDYRKVRDDAASSGHVAHAMIEAWIKKREFTVDPSLDEEIIDKAKQGYRGFLKWIEGTKSQLLHSEVELISERHQYGGRIDCVATIMDECCILDFKTTGNVYASYMVQVSAYRNAWNETHHSQKITGCHLLRIKKDDAGFVHHYFPGDTLDKAFRAFLVCRELYELQKSLEKLK